MDFRLYDSINDFVAAHPWLGEGFRVVEVVSIPLFVIAILTLWFFARPRSAARTWKFATASGLLAAAVALGIDRVVTEFWVRPRPFTVDGDGRVFGAHANDASFPSDHSAASFAIAFAVLAYNRVAGWLFVSAAALVAIGRVLVGVHYPGDVIAGIAVGAVAGLVAVRLLRPLVHGIVRLAERVTDPIVDALWREVVRARR